MNIWSFVYRVSWIALVIMALIATVFFFAPRWHEYQTYQVRRAEQLRLLQEKEALIKSYKDMQERFQTDPQFVVQLAHDLGMAKPGEIVFKFSEGMAVTTTPARAGSSQPSTNPALLTAPTTNALPRR